MTFLTAAQNASALLIGKKPATFFSSSETFEVKMCAIANEWVADLVREKDWRKLTVLKEMTGGTGTLLNGGAAEGFPIPDDYDHMPKGMRIHNASWLTWEYTPAASLDEWLYYINGEPLPNPGAWFILDGMMQFAPPVGTGTIAQYYYISQNMVLSNNGVGKAQFTADNDGMVYNERLLTLALIWRYRALERMEYAEDLQNYERYKDSIAGDDKGSTILINGGRRFNQFNGGFSYPWPLGV